MLFFLILLPIALIAAAWIAATISVRRSALHITADAVIVRNHRCPEVVVPIGEADHFEPSAVTGMFSGLRPPTGVLVRTDGTRITVRATAAPEAGVGIDALNARLATLRRDA